LVWHAAPGFRWADLAVDSGGRTGFELLPASRTGVVFTNLLDERAAAANRILENGSGVAIGDVDGDGRPDVLLCSLAGGSALFRNLGDWRFADVTAASGLVLSNAVCRGAAFADIDGDGVLDLLLTTLGDGVRVFRNDGAGLFRDVTAQSVPASPGGATTMALADIDGNGTLDLYVASYRAGDIRDRARIDMQFVNGRPVVPPHLRDRLAIGPRGLLEFGEPDRLLLNDGAGHFTEAPWTDGRFLDETGAPLAAPPRDWGLTATFRDVNGDGTPDLYVCNDYWTPDRLWLNDGRGHFRAAPMLALRHTPENSMGIDFADVDRDGQLDFLVVDMLARDPALRRRQVLAQSLMPRAIGDIDNRPQIMRNALFRARGDGTYADLADFAGLSASDWSWQPVFLDVDLDGYEDLLIPAGHRTDVQDLDATRAIQARQHPWPRDMEPRALQEAFTRELLDHSRLYPPLTAPIVAFRNLGGCRFEDVTRSWGTADRAVHQGIALGDLDGDGALDLVVNCLNGPAKLYRNRTGAPRVAVRLRGRMPNAKGIGACVRLLGGPASVQSQEMVCGGRYLSGFDPLLAFAAGADTNGLRLEVRWRDGAISVIDNVRPNRIYEIVEEAGQPSRESTRQLPTAPEDKVSVPLSDHKEPVTLSGVAPAGSQASPGPWFADVSASLGHSHREAEFDDFKRQPLLPRKLSQLGPGIAWADVNVDGHDDLLIAGGTGGSMGVFLGDGHGVFKPAPQNAAMPPNQHDQTGVIALATEPGPAMALVGIANYESGSAADAAVVQVAPGSSTLESVVPGDPSSAGPLAAADYDADGNLDLFVGGRVVPGRYPEPADSRLFRGQDGRFELDRANSARLAQVGLVSGVVFTDLDGDGFPELVLACEWGPIRIFRNGAGAFAPWDWPVRRRADPDAARVPLSSLTGWWAGVTAGDLDGDGRLDLIASNWGLNSAYRASVEHPLELHYGDLMDRGTVDLVEAEFDMARRTVTPRLRMDRMAAALPFLRERFDSFKAFSESTLAQVLGDRKTRVVRVTTLASMAFLNRGDHFEAVDLPAEAQWAPAFAVVVADFDGDRAEDLFISQNFFALPLETPRQDAGRGLLLRGDGRGGLQPVPGQESGIQVYGEQRGAAAADFDEDGRTDLAVTQNGAATVLYRNKRAQPGLRVRLRGSPGNPNAVGSVLRLQFKRGYGPAHEIHAGSGYWSQDSAVSVLGGIESAVALEVRWPGGKVTAAPIPAGARTVLIQAR
jgi:hypothetical protein